MTDVRSVWSTTATYDLHKRLINQYFLCHPGDTAKLKRDTSRDKTDYDVIRENHKFLWNDDEAPTSWEAKLAKKYYDKLFKEYCICDLSHYQDNMVAMRWRTEKEVVSGKGQFTCGEKHCTTSENLKTWEVNFGYLEGKEKKNALVKIRLCDDCSIKLNHRKRHREVTKKTSKKKCGKRSCGTEPQSDSQVKKIKTESETEVTKGTREVSTEEASAFWQKVDEQQTEKSKEDEFNEYLDDLFF